jgi:hypothetical protein
MRFDAPQISSDGGAVLLREVDDQLGLSAWVAAALPDKRCPQRVIHDRREQVRQRLYQIALGYEDCNDATQLRHDPVLKAVCDREPAEEQGLSSQPTLSRLENAVDMASVKRLIEGLEDSWVAQLDENTSEVVLDIDTTDDQTHGGQQLAFFHGYYDHHMYHPLVLFDGEGQLVSVLLRPGNVHAGRGAMSVLQRVISKLKARFPAVQVVVRADAGFALPRVFARLEQLNSELGGIDYLIGIAKNPALLRLAEPALQAAEEKYHHGRNHVRDCRTLHYAAQSWPHQRAVVLKAEVGAQGRNPRFVVTTLDGFDATLLYEAYCDRGQSENYIKDFKNALAADRLSCSSFVANSLRLLLHAAAYRLLRALRDTAATVRSELGRMQFDTLRLRLLKVAALVRRSVRRLWIQLPAAFPLGAVFRHLAAQLAAPRAAPA